MRTFEDILREVTKDGRVCPQPDHWNRLWEMLPGRRRHGISWEPPLPFIPAAWWESSDSVKRERLNMHIRWAQEHGALEQVAQFIFSLKPEGWYRGT